MNSGLIGAICIGIFFILVQTAVMIYYKKEKNKRNN